MLLLVSGALTVSTAVLKKETLSSTEIGVLFPKGNISAIDNLDIICSKKALLEKDNALLSR